MAPRKHKKAKTSPEDANKLPLEGKASTHANTDKPDDGPKETEPQQSESEAAITSTHSTAKKSYGSARGVSRMYKVLVKKAQAKKIKVSCNRYGEPVGDTRKTLQSYVGMLARTTIPIDISSWPEVDRQVKGNLWKDINDTFIVPPELESSVLQSAGVKWRQFKTKLTSQFVMPFLGQKKKLRKPPKKYEFVGKDTWKKFVASRASESWQPLRKKHSAIVKKRKYPHRMSRKGYIGLLEDLVKEGLLEPEELPDRAILWKKGRKRKDGKDDEELQKIYEKIDMLLEKKEKGEFEPSGTCDVLSTALESAEHSGRVRGVGGCVTPKLYFGLPKEKRTRITKAELLARDRERDLEMERVKQEFQAQIEALKALISPGSEKASCKMPDQEADQKKAKYECVGLDTPSFQQKGPRKCELAVDTIENKVAFGMVVEEAELNKLIHGVPMPEGCVRVLVDGIIQKDALVPVPVVGEIERVEEAVGSQLAWPRELIIFPNVKILTKRKESSRKPKNDLQGLAKSFNDTKPHKNVPIPFKLLYKHAKTFMRETGTSIPIPCDVEVFGADKIIYILHENLIALLEFDMLGQSVISAYMAYLHTVIRKEDSLDLYAFCDPGATFTLNKDFETYIVNRLEEGNADRMFLMPHNHNEHWILVIIWNGDIFLCNPLSSLTRFTPLEKALSSAIKSFNMQRGRGSGPPAVKYLLGSPKQPGGTECGYVVMRYMRDIVLDKEMKFTTKWATKTRASYRFQELDEVRDEAAAFIQDKML